MIIFNGDQLALEKEALLKSRVKEMKSQGKQPKIAAILFQEDAGSQLYTQLKSEAAQRVGIEYEVFTFSMIDGVEKVAAKVQELNRDDSVTGIIIQKPWRHTWVKTKGISQDGGPKAVRQAFNSWWGVLTTQIDLTKDVDGLHPDTLAAVKANTWQQHHRVLPATARAVITILNQAFAQLKIKEPQQLQVLVLGRSDIVGQPVFYELQNQGFSVKMLTRDDVKQRLKSNKKFLDADIVISATGVKHLVNGEMVKEGVILVDVGEPLPDIDFESLQEKPAFITPVPGGVGPMTVVSLLQNCLDLLML